MNSWPVSLYLIQDTSGGEQSVIVQKEKDRLALIRMKTHAALVIQLAWRRLIFELL